MRVMTAAGMAAFDRHCILELGVPGLLLMEHAGHLLAGVVLDRLRGTRNPSVAVLCGGGNNGGDGFVAARHLCRWGVPVSVACLKPREAYKGDAAENYELLSSVCGIDPVLVEEDTVAGFLAGHTIAVDALFGTGLGGELRGKGLAAVEALNRSGIPVVAADIPSGFRADGGGAPGTAVRAACTVTMGLPKKGFFEVGAGEWLGNLYVADIGFPRSALSLQEPGGEVLEVLVAGEAVEKLPGRFDGAHKGDFGKLLVIGGSRGMAGAAVLAARSALRAGAGLVTLAVPENVRAEAASMAPEVMTFPLPGGDGYLSADSVETAVRRAEWADAVVIGPGLGRAPETVEFVSRFLASLTIPAVIDADGLFALGESMSFEGRRVVLTPHEGEAGRLCSVGSQVISADRLRWARRIAVQRGAAVVLKGPYSLVCDESGGAVINPTGNAGMATAGSGDVLAGVTGAFLASGSASPLELTAAAVYVHGLAGDLAAQRLGERGLVSSDLVDYMPEALKLLEEVKPARGNPYPETLPFDGLSVVA